MENLKDWGGKVIAMAKRNAYQEIILDLTQKINLLAKGINKYEKDESAKAETKKGDYGPYIQNKLLCGFCTGSGLDVGQEVCKPCRGTGLETQKILRVADMRDLEGQHLQEKISYSRMIEILNEKATRYMYEWVREQIQFDYNSKN